MKPAVKEVKANAGKAPKSDVSLRRQKGKSYSRFIYRILKLLHPDLSLSLGATKAMSAIIEGVFDLLSAEAARGALCNKRSSITSREVQTAVKLLLTGALAKHAVWEGSKAVAHYVSSH